MKNKPTLTEYLATRLCESDPSPTQNSAKDLAEELATVIHENCQDSFNMNNEEWDKINVTLAKFVEENLLYNAEKLAKDWAEDNEEWIKEIEEASHGQY